MKKIILSLLLFYSLLFLGQTPNPTIDTEICPNVEYTISVSGLPGKYAGTITTMGGVSITQYPSSSGTSIILKQYLLMLMQLNLLKYLTKEVLNLMN